MSPYTYVCFSKAWQPAADADIPFWNHLLDRYLGSHEIKQRVLLLLPGYSFAPVVDVGKENGGGRVGRVCTEQGGPTC